MKSPETFSEHEGSFEPYHLMLSAMPYMVESARVAANEKANSYRDFHVGAAVFAINPVDESSEIFSAGNLKVKREKDKVCAEKIAIKKAQKAGMIEALGVVVVATTDIELIKGVTGAATPTLPMCADCQDPKGAVAGSKLVTDKTLVVTTGLDKDLYQVHLLSDMQEAFADGRGEELQEARPYFNWQLIMESYDFAKNQELSRLEGHRKHPALLAKAAMLGQMFDN